MVQLFDLNANNFYVSINHAFNDYELIRLNFVETLILLK